MAAQYNFAAGPLLFGGVHLRVRVEVRCCWAGSDHCASRKLRNGNCHVPAD